ncbi:hypothetical protein SERLA73DRAFT_157968 [Serpula lacrymans var. lacrymans S7.3]|uniref:Uncharacterized protein n=2 Tax=Serpula lacrymans var. lacrymans TaxID=341189 RepID=F8PJ01_SERL3|nr:uncharacterized protein SERLADRAFT_412677 [Serpula lacrymans var. lacrymans S7.9]EGO03162.1 hypothetical protein SERLA73DRAFT_157968 [Serpula lacrymans var. lacrymans S7.3]EGO28945.1 hypothetical protein SERLADRAFT_412677 [Serpula lacrymans var. lacrymans S7.9]
MSTHRILDSSPIPIPPTRPPFHAAKEVEDAAKSRSLKRSASVASLPTPPRTHHKRTRSRARSSASNHSSDESGSDPDGDLGGGYAARLRAAATRDAAGKTGQSDTGSLAVGSKRRRTSKVLAGQHDEEEDENAFWTGRSGTATTRAKGVAATAQDASKEASQSRSPSPALLRYRVKAPVSPPPSRRQSQAPVQTQRATTPPLDEPPLPVTPPRRLFAQTAKPALLSRKKSKSREKIWPVRDSPNNPFLEIASSSAPLDNEWDTSSDEESDVIGEALEREGTPTPAKVHAEKPTITYVFRGQKATFQNPLYDLPASVLAASRLPVDHPDFEAYDACPPKKLFVEKKQKPKDIDASSGDGQDTHRVVREKGSKSRSTSAEREPVFSKPPPCEPMQVKSQPGSASLSRASSAERVDKGRERADVLVRVRESREQRERESKARMESREGLRAGAVYTEKDDPARRAMGPERLSSGA